MKKGISLFLIFLIVLSVLLFFYNANKKLVVTPESERRLSSIVLAIDSTAKSPAKKFFKTHQRLIEVLPKNTIVYLLGTKKDLQSYAQKFRGKNIIPLEVSRTNFWIQDSFEVLGKDTLLVPSKDFFVFNPAFSFSVLKKLKPHIIETPFYFEGGNMTLARLPNGKVAVFLGFGAISKTANQWQKKSHKSLEELQDEAEQKIRGFFDQYDIPVVILGDEKENQHLIHIDQAILFVDKKNVILADYQDRKFPRIFEQLDNYRQTLQNLSYTIHRLPYSDDDIVSQKFTLNSLVFENSADKKEVIFPIFSDEFVEQDGQVILQGKAQVFSELLKKLNITPHSVIDSAFYKFNGSLHCITNVLD